MTRGTRSPVRVGLVDGSDEDVLALRSALRAYSHRVAIQDARQPRTRLDIALADVLSGDETRLAHVAESYSYGRAKLVVYTWSTRPESVAHAFRAGAAGYLHKGLGPADLLSALESITIGAVLLRCPVDSPGVNSGFPDWTVRSRGLTTRELSVLSMIGAGMSNQQIAEATYLSINSVKSFIRSAYRKIGVKTRPEALRWALHHGLTPPVSGSEGIDDSMRSTG